MSKTEEEKKEYRRQYYLKNKAKICEKSADRYRKRKEQLTNSEKEKKLQHHRDWYLINKEKVKIQSKKYRDDNKEKIRERDRKYRDANKEKIRERLKKYNKTDNGIKSRIINHWKSIGLVDDYNIVYERFEYTLFCDECKCDLDQCMRTRKSMDHDHKTGLFRNVLCNSCNVKRG